MFMDGFGRAIARWNCLAIKMIISWERFASRASRARSAQKCVFYYISFETWTVKKDYKVSQTNDLVKR